MAKIYTSLSNYAEENIKDRKKTAEEEIFLWGTEREKFVKYREDWNKSADENYLPSHPLHVDIELSDACNLRCKMCAHGLGTIQNVGFMSNKLALRMIDECHVLGVSSIKFNWRGEATLDPFLPCAIEYAKKKRILEVQINTNGLPKKKDILTECAKRGIDRIIFSVDGFSKDTYEFMRIGGDYQELLENINNLVLWKKENNMSKPLLRIQMVRTKTNAHEVNNYLKYWKPLVDDVRISDVTDRGQGEQFSVGDQITVGRRRCTQPFQRLAIARDGRVSPCCADWNQEFVVGDANSMRLIDIWNGEKMQYIRTIQNANEHYKIKICNKCCVKESYVWRKNWLR